MLIKWDLEVLLKQRASLGLGGMPEAIKNMAETYSMYFLRAEFWGSDQTQVKFSNVILARFWITKFG